MKKLVESALRDLLGAGFSVAVDATNITKESRTKWVKFARTINPDIKISAVWLTGTFDSADRWIKERNYTEAEYWIVRKDIEAHLQNPVPGDPEEPNFVPKDFF